MKANEAPEKLYVNFQFIETHPWSYQPLVTKQGVNKYDIEYTRTDAFIEKATEWLRKNADNYTWYNEFEGESGMVDEFIEVFRNYMKGE